MPHSNRNWIVIALVVLLAASIDVVASLLLRNPAFGFETRIEIALMPLPGNIALIVLATRGIRKLDDFQRHVHFEAVTVAFLSTGVVVFVYGYLQKAHVVGSLNAGLVWIFMLVFYAIGYSIAAAHYK